MGRFAIAVMLAWCAGAGLLEGGAATAPRATYAWHTGIVATTFWVGEVYKPNAPDGSQACSTYDSSWAFHWSGGVHIGPAPRGTDCAGAPEGGCDGVAVGTTTSTFTCNTERRTALNGFYPTGSGIHPAENPFYLDLPYDDLNNRTAFGDRCAVVPWASIVDPGSKHCRDKGFSYMKNHWVRLVGPNGATCYGQIEDAGPFKYDDERYVFGAADARPVSKQANNAGLDVSPALNGCLGFSDLDGDTDRVSWQFVDSTDVPMGPWKTIVTSSPVS